MQTLKVAICIVVWMVSSTTAIAQNSPAEPSAILTVLNHSAEDWNRGDLDAFAASYKNSPDILFIGKDHQPRLRADARALQDRVSHEGEDGHAYPSASLKCSRSMHTSPPSPAGSTSIAAQKAAATPTATFCWSSRKTADG